MELTVHRCKMRIILTRKLPYSCGVKGINPREIAAISFSWLSQNLIKSNKSNLWIFNKSWIQSEIESGIQSWIDPIQSWISFSSAQRLSKPPTSTFERPQATICRMVGRCYLWCIAAYLRTKLSTLLQPYVCIFYRHDWYHGKILLSASPRPLRNSRQGHSNIASCSPRSFGPLVWSSRNYWGDAIRPAQQFEVETDAHVWHLYQQ